MSTVFATLPRTTRVRRSAATPHAATATTTVVMRDTGQVLIANGYEGKLHVIEVHEPEHGRQRIGEEQ